MPSITAPGLDIIAAYGTYTGGDDYPIEWGVMSGTSMSSPHVAGSYALLADARPDWSPAQTQSALQLTARPDTPKEDGAAGDPHSEGSGYADLDKAADAGFVLDIAQQDYQDANPDEGGDVRQLNAAELVNFDLAGDFTWERTLGSTQETDVTWDVSYTADDGITLGGSDQVTINAGDEADLSVTVTVDEDTAVGETLYGRVNFTPDANLPDAHMPVAVTISEQNSDLDIENDAIDIMVEEGDVVEETLEISNIGGELVDWALAEEGRGTLWSQQIDGGIGIMSNYYINPGAGVYAADDFILTNSTELSSVFTPGLWLPTATGSITQAETLTWHIYEDHNGVPAGHPEEEDGREPVWSFSASPNSAGVVIDDEDVSLYVESSEADPLALEEGHYWLVFFPDIESEPRSPYTGRWNWYRGIGESEPSQLVDPEDLFGRGVTEWGPFDEMGLVGSGLAFTLDGELRCALPDDVDWLEVSPTSGALAPGDSNEITVTFDAVGAEIGEYRETICFGAHDPLQPVVPVTLDLEVVTTGTVEGLVTANETGLPIEQAAISVEGEDWETATNEEGHYSFGVPAGEHTFIVEADGYIREFEALTIEGDGTYIVDYTLDPLPPAIGIAGDFANDLAGFLDGHGYPSETYEWGDNPADYPVIVLNRPGDPGEELFMEFLDEAEAAGTGVVMLDTRLSTGSGVELLHDDAGNPGARGSGSGEGALSYAVTTEHPLVEGFEEGELIPFDTSSGSFDYAWFDDYSGNDVTMVADAVVDGETVGGGVAIEEAENNRHVLLSMHGSSTWALSAYWAPGGEQLFLNAVDWAWPDEAPESVTVEPSEATVPVGGDKQLTALATYEDEDEPVDVTADATWVSEDADTAMVSDEGVATGVGVGETDVSATFAGLEGGSVVTVTEADAQPPELVELVVSPDETSVEVGESDQLTAMAIYEDEEEPVDVTADATWVSEDENTAMVSGEGVVTGVGEGDVEVAALYKEVEDSSVVTVTEGDDQPVEDPLELEVTPAKATIGVNGTEQLAAWATYGGEDEPVDVSDTVYWESGDPDVATVDETGVVTGVADGEVYVTAELAGLSDSATVTVDAGVEPGPEGLERISAPPGRVEVAIAASQHRFVDGEADVVVLARADDYPDALAGTTLAAEHDAPLLLTSSDELLDHVADEVSRVLVNEGAVYLTGGTAALDHTVEEAVDELGFDSTRLGGETRFETAGLIAEELGKRSQVLVTTGLDFPDALTAGAAAAVHDGVVLLSAGDDAHEVVDEYLAGFDGGVSAVGGPATRAYPDAEPVMGETRDETAVAVAEAFFDEPVAFGVARRDDYPDALAGGAHIAAYEGPLLLSYTEDVPAETAEWLQATEATGGFVYGGTAAIDEDTFDQLDDLTFNEDGDSDDDR